MKNFCVEFVLVEQKVREATLLGPVEVFLGKIKLKELQMVRKINFEIKKLLNFFQFKN